MELQVQGTSYKCTFTRMHLLDVWSSMKGSMSEADKIRRVFHELMISIPDFENVDSNSLLNRVKYICNRISIFWKEAKRSKSKIVEKHRAWLNVVEECILTPSTQQPVENIDSMPCTSSSNSSTGNRHRKDFADCCKRTQRRRLASLCQADDSAFNSLQNKSENSTVSQFSTEEVLSLIVQAKLTKHQYLLFKELIHSKIPDVLPSYHKVLEEKKRCYPSEERITESSAEVSLQSLLDHTTTRILESQKQVLSTISPNSSDKFLLIGKWGFDGSTGHSEYKQSFSDSNIEDGNLFVTSYVPLQLVCKSNTSDPDRILWKNPRPSSTRFCRPIRFQFAKETKELSVQEEAYITNQINNLQSTAFVFDNHEIRVQHSLQLTMVDGKVCCALSETSFMTCYICGATPKQMNDIQSSLSRPVDSSKFQFGLSPLHSYIRFFEFFIHISYKLDIKKWQARSDEDKALVAQKKQLVQQQFRDRLGLIVDKPRSGGSGTSNDGNTARKFFQNSAISAEITGINKELIERCCHLLQCLSSGYKVNTNKFKEYALQTAEKLVQAYPWYNLPASVHKVLIHGSEVINFALLSIGELSEEAAEASNKNIKLFRRDNTRKMSRVLTNTDLLHRLLLNSDPFISSLRKLPCKKKSLLSREVLNMLEV